MKKRRTKYTGRLKVSLTMRMSPKMRKVVEKIQRDYDYSSPGAVIRDAIRQMAERKGLHGSY